MKRRLSSRITLFYKAMPFFLAIWLLYGLVFNGGTQKNDLAFGFLFAVIWFLFTRRWKMVYVENGSLRISNYLRTITIEPSSIANVRASSWWESQPRTITIKFSSSTPFGQKIIFVPQFWGGEAAEVANELTRLRHSALTAK